MSSETTNYKLKLYDSSDTTLSFLNYILSIHGPASSSDAQKLETALTSISSRTTALESVKSNISVIGVSAGGGTYTATASAITAYTDGLSIALQLPETNAGSVVLNINGLGNKTLEKFGQSTLVTMFGGDLKVGKTYIFRYYSSANTFVWVQGTSGDQISVAGTNNNLLSISQFNTIEDSMISKQLITDITNYALTGWMTPPIGIAFGYVNGTSFTTVNNTTETFIPGTKLRFDLATSSKYFYVISSSYSGGWTTVTVAGDTVTNETPTAIYFSRASNALGFPHWFSWTPTYTASGSMTFASVTTTVAQFRIIGRELHFQIRALGTTGGTASNTLLFTLPVACATSGNLLGFGAYTVDTASGGAYAFMNSTTQVSVRKYDSSNYGLGTQRALSVQGSYDI